MPHARFYKTLMLPGIEAQHRLWRTELSKVRARVDETIQFGNLISLYPDRKDGKKSGPNNAILNMVALWVTTDPGWIQLIGPNELIALNSPDEWTNAESNQFLRNNWFSKSENSLNGGFRVATVSKGRLLTHGGMTHGEWVSIGKPQSPQEAADRLEEKYWGKLYLGDGHRLNGRPRLDANPVFADPLWEVYPSWIYSSDDMPFDQVHAAPGLNTQVGRYALTSELSPLGFLNKTRYTKFGSEVWVAGGRFLNVHLPLPHDRLVKYLDRPWRFYVEKTPVLDLRDHLWLPLEEDAREEKLPPPWDPDLTAKQNNKIQREWRQEQKRLAEVERLNKIAEKQRKKRERNSVVEVKEDLWD